MTSRERVLGRIRDAHAAAPQGDIEVPRTYRSAGELDVTGVTELFAERVDDYRATVTRTPADALPATIVGIVASADARRIVVPAGLDRGWLTGLPDDIEVVTDPPAREVDDLDTVDLVITAAAVGIAETGTIVLDGGDDQGRRAITLVPDHHLCVIRADQLVQTVPEAMPRLDPTRPLTWISGPSATSDIELDRVEGVHGPRTLDVIIVDPAEEH